MNHPSGGRIAGALRSASLALAFGTVLLAAPADAQEPVRIGNVYLRPSSDPVTGEDRSLAVVFSTEGAERALMWGCGGGGAGLFAALTMEGRGEDGETRRVVWRFDGGRPDTTVLVGQRGSDRWRVRGEDLAAFTSRARSARSLVIRVFGDGGTAEYAYDLTGSGAALDRLSCARTPRAPREADFTGQGAVAPSRPNLDDVRGELKDTYELSAVEDLPRLRNYRHFTQALMRNYPPALRDAGVGGRVDVRFRILQDGTVDSASIAVVESDNEGFNEAAIRAVREMVFAPARVNRRPVRVWVVQPIVFEVQAPAPPAPTTSGR